MSDLAMTLAPDAGADLGETVDSTTETTDTSNETTGAETETTEAGTETDGQQTEADRTAPPVANGKLSAAAKATIDELKKTSPGLAKAIQRSLFLEDRMRRELPGGIQELQQLRSRVEEMGGETGIQEFQKEIDGWRHFDEQYTAGDPKVLEFLTETPAAMEAFNKIAPAAFDKYRESNPDGYSHYIAQVMWADMNRVQIGENQFSSLPLLLERLGDLIPAENPKAAQLLGILSGYVNRVSQIANSRPAAPKSAAAPETDKRAQELDAKEKNFARTEWRTEAGRRHASLYNQQWKAIVGERKLTPTQSDAVRKLYGVELGSILQEQKDFNGNLEKYFGAGQKDGFLKYHDSIYKIAVPKALRRAMEQAGIGAKPSSKAGDKTDAGKQPAGKQQAAPTGFVFVNQKPAFEQVNRILTTPDMWTTKRQAILKDGKRVTWK